MGGRKAAPPPKPNPAPAGPPRPDEQTLQILLKEYDALRDLFTQSENSVQGIFNFYLTLVSTIGGAVVVIWQVTQPDSAEAVRNSQMVTSVLMLFVSLIGAVYLSSITGRYAHMDRYAEGIDQLRRYLLGFTGGAYPPIYQTFLNQAAPATPAQKDRGRQDRAVRLVLWFSPTGTYQLFVATLSSLTLAGGVWLFLAATGITVEVPARSIVTCVVIGLVSYILFNVYSRYVKTQLVSRLNIQVDSSREAPFITGKH